MRRLLWFLTGVAAGISTFVWAKKKVVTAVETVSPAGIRRRVTARLGSLPARTRNAIAAGRSAFHDKSQQSRNARQR
jgi:hypothetical protein